MSERHRLLRDRLLVAGVCMRCRKEPTNGTGVNCEACREYINTHRKKLKAKVKARMRMRRLRAKRKLEIIRKSIEDGKKAKKKKKK